MVGVAFGTARNYYFQPPKNLEINTLTLRFLLTGCASPSAESARTERRTEEDLSNRDCAARETVSKDTLA